jgi:gluconokinase
MRIVSIDVGTTNIKSALIEFDEDEKALRIVEARNIPQQAISDGVIHEHSPKYVVDRVLEELKHYALNYRSVDAVAFSTYLFSQVLVNDAGEPITNIITWLDRRAEKVMHRIASVARLVYERTGCPPLTIYNLPKILYLSEHKHELLRSAKLILDAKSFLTLKLAGEAVTDLSTASGTYQMLNIWSLKWDAEVLAIAGVDEEKLPTLAEADYKLVFRYSVARSVGLDPFTPIILGLYDGGSMIFGLAGGRDNVAVVNTGTSSMLRVIGRRPVIDKSGGMTLQTYYLYRGTWIPGLAWSNCGVVLEKMAQILNVEISDAIGLLTKLSVEDFIASTPPVTVPLLYPERIPSLSFELGVAVMGIRPEHSKLHILASALEGVILPLKYASDVVESSGLSYSVAICGGKVLNIPLAKKLLASALGKSIMISEYPDATHFGNALMALKALGALKDHDVAEISKGIVKEVVEPEPRLSIRISFAYRIFKAYLDTMVQHFKAQSQ